MASEGFGARGGGGSGFGSAASAGLQAFAEGIFQGSPDCWPKIHHAVDALIVAANRATTHAWNIVTQREATIHQLTHQINNQLLPKQYALQRELEQLRQIASQQHSQVLKYEHALRLTQQQAGQEISKINLRAQHERRALTAHYGSMLANSEKKTRDCTHTVAILRTDETDLQREVENCRSCGKRQTAG